MRFNFKRKPSWTREEMIRECRAHGIRAERGVKDVANGGWYIRPTSIEKMREALRAKGVKVPTKIYNE